MKTTTYINRTLGVEVPVTVPASCEDFDASAGQVGTAWSMAVRYALYHIWNVKFRSSFAKKVVEETGEPLPQKVEGGKPVFKKGKDDDGAEIDIPVYVSEQVYINSLLAKELVTEGQLQEWALEVASEIPLELTGSNRTLKPNAKNKRDAQTLCTAFDSGEKDADEFVAKWNSLNPGKDFTRDCGEEVNVESVAVALRINDERKLRESEF